MAQASEFIVGIDLGTTNSEVAVWREGKVHVLEEHGSALFPSVVGFSPEGQLLVGAEARNQFVLHPDLTVKSIKRRMGLAEKVRLGGRDFGPPELSAFILRALKERAERVLGQPVHKAVITVPAYFSDAQRQATRDAGRIAGLEVVRMIHEPTAAVLAYGCDGAAGAQAASAQTILVYDLGGGTLDVSIVQVQGEVTEVLSSHGDTRLGGDDFDQLLLEYFLRRLREKEAWDVREDDRAARHRLLRAAEEAKQRLSFEEHVRIREEHIGYRNGVPVHLDVPVTREEFEALVRPLLQRSLECVHKALDGAGKAPAALDRVLLVGGSTRIPLVSRMLREALGQEPRKDIHPDLCVAYGAGVLASRSMGCEVQKILVDITPYTFGTSALGEIGGMPVIDKFVPLIRKNTPLPAMRYEDFATLHDEQEAADMRVFQGEEQRASRNIEVGRFLVAGLSPVPAGNPIRLRMDLDINGILHVTAIETRTGLQKSVVIEDAFGALSEEELVRARQRVAGALESRIAGALGAAAAPLVTATGGGPVPSATAAASSAIRLSNAKVAQSKALLEKARKLQSEMHPDDREDAGRLIRNVEETLAQGEPAGLEKCLDELADLVFFVEEKA